MPDSEFTLEAIRADGSILKGVDPKDREPLIAAAFAYFKVWGCTS